MTPDRDGISGEDEISGGARRKLVFLDDDISEDKFHVKSLSPANRLGEIEIATNCQLQSCQQCRAFEESRNRLKTLFLSFPNKRRELSASASSSRTGPDVHLMEESKSKEGNCANNYIDPGVVLQFQQSIPYAYSALEDMSRKDDAELTHDDAMDKENYVHFDKLDFSTDVAMTKSSFLSLQGIDSQDSLGTQLNSCVKCNKGGNLLSCSSSSCPVVVHEECLGSAIGFDRLGIFYCPFCAYARSISQYVEAKKIFSLARADLTTFHDVHFEPANDHDSLSEDIWNLIFKIRS